MNYRFPNSPPPSGFFARLLGAIVGLVMMIGLFFIGLTVFAAAAGVALVVFVIFYIRLWWLQRHHRRQGGATQHEARGGERKESVTLEGEYREKDD